MRSSFLAGWKGDKHSPLLCNGICFALFRAVFIFLPFYYEILLFQPFRAIINPSEQKRNGIIMLTSSNNKKIGLTNNQLKIIAMISMLIDHVGLVFFPNNPVFRYIGRLSFPIFAFMIAEGCRYTKNRKKHLATILSMAITYQLVYLIFLKDLYQGILVTFSLSIISIYSIEGFIRNKKLPYRLAMIASLLFVIIWGVVFPILFKNEGFAVDYDVWGIVLPILIYFMPDKKRKLIALAILLISMSLLSNSIQWYSLFALPLLLLYNGKRGKANLKYLFYIFYPLHLVIIYAVAILIAILS